MAYGQIRKSIHKAIERWAASAQKTNRMLLVLSVTRPRYISRKPKNSAITSMFTIR